MCFTFLAQYQLICHGHILFTVCAHDLPLSDCSRCSKQLLNDVIFIWFIDKNLFTLPTLKNSHRPNSRLYAAAATKKKDVGAKLQNAFFAQE